MRNLILLPIFALIIVALFAAAALVAGIVYLVIQIIF